MNINLLNKLDIDGYCVVPDIISLDKSDEYINRIWDWLESLGTGLERNDSSTWNSNNWPPNINGIIQQLRAGQEQFAWDIRCEPNVINVFENIWKTNKLLVSSDSICIMIPPEISGVYQTRNWLHVDQSSKKIGKHCIQGFVNLEETGEEDACLLVYKGSHIYHKELFERNGKTVKHDWYELNKNDLEWIENKNLELVRVTAPKGSMVLWDSRLIHCNTTAKGNRLYPRFRYVIYVCMTPSEWCDSKNKEDKIKAFNELRVTTHWPHEIKLFSESVERYGKKITDFNIRQKCALLSDRGKQLAGLLNY